MLPDEILKMLEEAADPDKAPEALLMLKTKLEDLTNALNTANKEKEEKDTRIQNLTDTNQRLFLRVTGTTPAQDTAEEPKEIEDMTPEERDTHFRTLFNKEENDNGN